MTATLVHVFLAYRPSVVCFILLPFLRGARCCGATHTDVTVCNSTFYTVKLNGSSRCIERKDVVHCWNAASSQVKISILETANIGSCVLLNPVALAKLAVFSEALLIPLNKADQGPSATGQECNMCMLCS